MGQIVRAESQITAAVLVVVAAAVVVEGVVAVAEITSVVDCAVLVAAPQEAVCIHVLARLTMPMQYAPAQQSSLLLHCTP